MHAEGHTTAAVLLLCELYKRPVHVCHVARKEEVNCTHITHIHASPSSYIRVCMVHELEENIYYQLGVHCDILLIRNACFKIICVCV